MPNEVRNLPRLMTVTHALGALHERVVFGGEAIVKLYSTTPTTPPEPRITDDVDRIMEVTPRATFH